MTANVLVESHDNVFTYAIFCIHSHFVVDRIQMYLKQFGSRFIKLDYRSSTFFTASLYCSTVLSLSPSFFSLVTESLYSCTSLLPSSCSRASSPSPAAFMRNSVSNMLFWDGLSSQLYSSMSATVFSASQASVFWMMRKTEHLLNLGADGEHTQLHCKQGLQDPMHFGYRHQIIFVTGHGLGHSMVTDGKLGDYKSPSDAPATNTVFLRSVGFALSVCHHIPWRTICATVQQLKAE